VDYVRRNPPRLIARQQFDLGGVPVHRQHKQYQYTER
jgi:hypothetical protein